jgi:hypothetical protein
VGRTRKKGAKKIKEKKIGAGDSATSQRVDFTVGFLEKRVVVAVVVVVNVSSFRYVVGVLLWRGFGALNFYSGAVPRLEKCT